jgi:serine/threonine protein kinase
MTAPRSTSSEQFPQHRTSSETPPADVTIISPDPIPTEGAAPQQNDVCDALRTRSVIPEGLPDDAFLSLVQYDTGLDSGQEDQKFAADHPEYARTVRLLRDTFGSLTADRKESGIRNETESSGGDSIPKQPAALGRFEIRRQIGSGSFGIVWLAWDPHLCREVAIKVPHPEVRMDAEVSRRFLREARAARLNHQNIVRVLEAGVEDGVAFMATEYIDGESLGDRLRRQERVSIRDSAILIQNLADAAHHAHVHGVLHRDIKPDNILLEQTSHSDTGEPGNVGPRLTDFGLAKTSDGGGKNISGIVIGTPDYMAPEQALGDNQNHGPFTDVYSLGVVLYELLTGKVPENRTFKSLRRQCSEIPRDLESICLRCVECAASRRYATAAALSDDLKRFLEGRPTFARPLSLLEQLTRWQRAPNGKLLDSW